MPTKNRQPCDPDLVVKPTLHISDMVELMAPHDEQLTLSAAVLRMPSQVKSALRKAVPTAAQGEPLLTPEELAWIRTFPAQLP
jgi:hypothetical protein